MRHEELDFKPNKSVQQGIKIGHGRLTMESVLRLKFYSLLGKPISRGYLGAAKNHAASTSKNENFFRRLPK